MNQELEIRSFISKEQYEKLLNFFRKNTKLIKEDYQETFYFDSKEDLRIQKNNFYSKIWMKKGNFHDECRDEFEIKFSRDEFENLENLFVGLGYNVEIKWFRKRYEFEWNKTKVCLDFTKGYGYIIELEKMCSTEEKHTMKILEELKQNLKSLNINPKEEFKKKFEYYKEN